MTSTNGKKDNNTDQFEDLLNEALRFHGLLTPSTDEIAPEDVQLPAKFQSPDFLFEIGNKESVKLRLAAFKRDNHNKQP